MFPLKTLKPHHLHKLLRLHKPSIFTQTTPHESVKWASPPHSQRPFSTKFKYTSDPDEEVLAEMSRGGKSKKPKKGKASLGLPKGKKRLDIVEVSDTETNLLYDGGGLSEFECLISDNEELRETTGETKSGKTKQLEVELDGIVGEVKSKRQKKGKKPSKEALGESATEELDLDDKRSKHKGKKALESPLNEEVEGESEKDEEEEELDREANALKKLRKVDKTVSDKKESSSKKMEVRTKKQKKGKKPLDDLFKEAVGLTENVEGESETEDLNGEETRGLSKKMKEINELKKRLLKMEAEVRSMRGELEDRKTKKETTKKGEVSLSSLFASNPKQSHLDSPQTEKSVSKEKSVVSKQEHSGVSVKLKPMEELSPEAISFVKRLHEKGYLEKANFLKSHVLDLSCFSTPFSRGYLRCAAESFGKDHQEKAKLLSETDVKRLVLFGCPSTEKKTVFAAKRIRSYFNIQEDIVCRPCELNSSCQSKFHTVGKKADELNIADVMKILTLYALEMVSPQLTIPEEVKGAVSRLLKQVVKF